MKLLCLLLVKSYTFILLVWKIGKLVWSGMKDIVALLDVGIRPSTQGFDADSSGTVLEIASWMNCCAYCL